MSLMTDFRPGPDEAPPVRVVVAEDQGVVRTGVVMFLTAQPGMTVVAECSNGLDAVALTRRHRPDVVVMDVQMPGTDGIEATRQIVSSHPDRPDQLTRVLVLTTYADDETVLGALRVGASGIVLKHSEPRELGQAVQHVAAGNSWIDPAVTATVLGALARVHTATDGAALVAALTAREREILILMGDGLDNDQIARRLTLSLATVRTHVSRVLMKTGSHHRAQAVGLAYRAGLIPSVGPVG